MTPIGGAVSSPEDLAKRSPLLAPLIDPYTHDFLSLSIGMDPVDARVINALKVVRGSGPCVEKTGHRFRDIRKITPSTPNEIDNRARTALAGIIRDGDIRYIGTTIDYNESATQMIQARVQWINLRAGDGEVRYSTLLPTTGE